MAETAVSSIFYTSDLHLGHEKVAGYRGFKCSADHDYELGERWRNQVTDRDHVWILGDLCLHDLDYALAFIKNLPGTKHLVWGNHDAGHPMHRNAHKQQRRYLDVFDSVQPFARRKIAGEDVLLSHFPYERDRDEMRYGQWRLRNEGAWLLHGHTHGPERATVDSYELRNWRTGEAVKKTYRSREIHVGVDAWDGRLVPEGTVAELIGGYK